MFCAEGGTRTPTGLLPHAPETCASTNSTTSALKIFQKSSFVQALHNYKFKILTYYKYAPVLNLLRF